MLCRLNLGTSPVCLVVRRWRLMQRLQSELEIAQISRLEQEVQLMRTNFDHFSTNQ